MIDATCPICGRRMQGQALADWPQFPFCSPKCKLIDLGRWMKGSYEIPAEEPEEAYEETDSG
jgi:endogenous inhibitor of DNA gyrase (YacG/DUF329 family)